MYVVDAVAATRHVVVAPAPTTVLVTGPTSYRPNGIYTYHVSVQAGLRHEPNVVAEIGVNDPGIKIIDRGPFIRASNELFPTWHLGNLPAGEVRHATVRVQLPAGQMGSESFAISAGSETLDTQFCA